MKFISDDEYYKVISPILFKIVKRKYPSATSLGGLNFKDENNPCVYVLSLDCLICDKNIIIPDYTNEHEVIQFVRNHNYNDLKNHNLLPFL